MLLFSKGGAVAAFATHGAVSSQAHGMQSIANIYVTVPVMADT
jgi:hypothetical protein